MLTTLAGIVNYPLRDHATDSIDELRTGSGGHLLPGTPAGPVVTGPVLWTRDAYGSRFGVAAPLRTTAGRDRWYLWDIDACGHDAFTVHSRCHDSADEALADWQAGVGLPAAEGTVFAPIDDAWLLSELLPAEQGMLRPGGENAEQFAEYHRSKRMAEAVLDVIGPIARPPTPTPAALDHTIALLPDWTVWLAERDATPAHLADRCKPFVHGEQLGAIRDDAGLNYVARVTE